MVGINLGIIYNDKDGIHLKKPFSFNLTTKAYTKFSQIAKKHNIKVLIASPNWYKNKSFTKSWNLLTNKIEKNQPLNFILDRCLSFSQQHYNFMKKLRSTINKELTIINSPKFENICNNKYLTYSTLKKYHPTTIKNIKNKSKIKSELAVVKPFVGAAGKNIKILKLKNIKSLKKDYLIQEFIDTSKGIKNIFKGVHDLRAIILNGKIVDFYIRSPKKGLKSNLSLGGKLNRIKKIPNSILQLTKQIDNKFIKYKTRFYSIDYIIDKNQKPWVVELNSHPGFIVYFRKKNQQKIFENIIIKLLKQLK